MFFLYLGVSREEADALALRQVLYLEVLRYGGSVRYLSRKALKLERWAIILGHNHWHFRLRKAEEAKEFIRQNRRRFCNLTPVSIYVSDFTTHIDLSRV